LGVCVGQVENEFHSAYGSDWDFGGLDEMGEGFIFTNGYLPLLHDPNLIFG
jgi:hypothetical protein